MAWPRFSLFRTNSAPAKSVAGFTLIELMTVIAIVSVLSVVGTSILVNTQVRGTKATTLSRVRTEGVFLLDQVSFPLRGAQLVVTNTNGTTCQNNMPMIRIQQYDGVEKEIFRNGSNQLVIRSFQGGGSTDSILSSTGLVLSALAFDCVQETGQTGALVKVRFTVQTGQAGTTPAEQVFTQAFETQVSIRSVR